MHGLLRLQLTLIQALDQGEIGGSIKQRWDVNQEVSVLSNVVEKEHFD
jgi:hypothetical protein